MQDLDFGTRPGAASQGQESLILPDLWLQSAVASDQQKFQEEVEAFYAS